MIEWTNSKLVEITDLVRNAGSVAVIVVILMTYFKSRAFVPTLVASLVGGLFLWTIHNADWWQARVGEESGAPALVDLGRIDVDGPPLAGPVVVEV